MTIKVKTALNKLPIVIAMFYGLNLIGALIFMVAEHEQHVGFIESVYWAFITSLSVGYGDYSPATVVGMITAVFLAKLVLLIVLPMLITIFSDRAYENRNELTHEEQERAEAKLNAIMAHIGIDTNEFDKNWQEWCDRE